MHAKSGVGGRQRPSSPRFFALTPPYQFPQTCDALPSWPGTTWALADRSHVSSESLLQAIDLAFHRRILRFLNRAVSPNDLEFATPLLLHDHEGVPIGNERHGAVLPYRDWYESLRLRKLIRPSGKIGSILSASARSRSSQGMEIACA